MFALTHYFPVFKYAIFQKTRLLLLIAGLILLFLICIVILFFFLVSCFICCIAIFWLLFFLALFRAKGPHNWDLRVGKFIKLGSEMNAHNVIAIISRVNDPRANFIRFYFNDVWVIFKGAVAVFSIKFFSVVVNGFLTYYQIFGR